MAPHANVLYHPREGCATERATLKVCVGYRDIWLTNIAIDVAQGPGTEASTTTKISNMGVTQYLAKLLGGLQQGNAQELGVQSRLWDVGGTLEVLNSNMTPSPLEQW